MKIKSPHLKSPNRCQSRIAVNLCQPLDIFIYFVFLPGLQTQTHISKTV